MVQAKLLLSVWRGTGTENVLTVLPELSQPRQVRITDSANTHCIVMSLSLTPQKFRVVLSSTTDNQTQGATLLLSSILQDPVAAEQRGVRSGYRRRTKVDYTP